MDEDGQEDPRIAVVICDDHPVTALGLAGLLRTSAPDVTILGLAFNGTQAVELAHRLCPDVVVMDLYMPGVSGIEATRAIRDATPSTRVMILTMSTREEDLHEALGAGATGYVTKDQDIGDIISAIRAVDRGRLTIPAGIAGGFLREIEGATTSDLSQEERQILLFVAEGRTNKEIGEQIHLSERTVRRRIRDIHGKLRASDPRAAAHYAAQVGSLYAAQAAVWSQSARRRLEATRGDPAGTRSPEPSPPEG